MTKSSKITGKKNLILWIVVLIIFGVAVNYLYLGETQQPPSNESQTEIVPIPDNTKKESSASAITSKKLTQFDFSDQRFTHYNQQMIALGDVYYGMNVTSIESIYNKNVTFRLTGPITLKGTISWESIMGTLQLYLQTNFAEEESLNIYQDRLITKFIVADKSIIPLGTKANAEVTIDEIKVFVNENHVDGIVYISNISFLDDVTEVFSPDTPEYQFYIRQKEYELNSKS